MAHRLNCRFALVRSGVTLPGHVVADGADELPIAADVADLAAVAAAILA